MEVVVRREWTAACLLVALMVAGCGSQAAMPARSGDGAPPSAAVRTILEQSWQGYLAQFVSSDGRVMDPSRQQATTSEGQAYALLRAVWLGDHSDFTRIWLWTKANLSNGEGLFSWLWGRRGDGSWGVIDTHSAADADTDIALALFLGGARFNDRSLTAAGDRVVRAIWTHEVVQTAHGPVLVAGDWATVQRPLPVDPSYFAPYAYRVFAGQNLGEHWMQLVGSSYTILEACTGAALGETASAGLPPNWCLVDSHTGTVSADPGQPQASDYGYDAFRVMWRIALDEQWFHSARAREYLGKHTFLVEQWQSKHAWAAVYAHDGSVVSATPDLATYGGNLGQMLVVDPSAATSVVATLRASFHDAGSAGHFGTGTSYYQQNWVWFGLAMAAGITAPPGASS